MKSIRLLFVVALLLPLASISEGAVVANYDFALAGGSNVALPTSAGPLVEDPNVTAGAWSTGAGFVGNVAAGPGITTGQDNLGNTGYSTGNGFMFTSRNNGVNANGNQASAFNDGEYFEVTVAPDAGFEIDYETLSFYAFVNNKSRGADQFGVTSSVDGHVATSLLGSGEISPSGVSAANAIAYDIDLTGSQFQNVASATTFRIYLWSAGSSISSSLTGIDNVVFEGTVTAVPEPSSIALFGLGICGLLVRRRR